ncbi:hypothetical protein [Polluticoccus soli]|uniref:hypothetical protein n=1 Tax=Polluticoccus soli TaxID=3034150 RepID=UPI0023E1B4D6|nr:hypothetical protein [Flavipsychrobacter sp. JY13-12]
MTKTFSLATLVLASFSANAQQTTIEPVPTRENKLAFKVYNLTTFRPFVATGNQQFAHAFREHDYLQPTVALRIQNKRKNFHEIELSEFSIRKRKDQFIQSNPYYFPVTMAGMEVTTTSLAARYEYTWPFFKKSKESFVPSIGVAGGLFYERFKTTPYTTVVFPTTETMAGMRGFIVPRLNWYAGKRLFFDLNVPVCLLQADYQHSDQKNPTIPEAMQSMGVINFDLLPKYYSFRIGAGWKI